MSQPAVRTATRDELETMLGWARAEGWNPGLDDADLFFAADPGGFHVATLDERVIGTMSLVRYGNGSGFLGLYIVDRDYRGRGYGRAMWDSVLAAQSLESIGLDGVVAQQTNYAASGFVFSHRNLRFAVSGLKFEVEPEDDEPVSGEILDALKPSFPAPRNGFNKLWWAHPRHVRAVKRRDGRIAGLGVARRCDVGWKIGPLIAQDELSADHVFRRLAAAAHGQQVVLDVPEPNLAAIRLAERYGMKVVFETARMVRGTFPLHDLAPLYGVTTLELG